MKEARRARGKGGVSPGAYYRVIDQARSNVEEALYTLLFCSKLKVLQGEDLRRLLDTVAKTPSELDEETSRQVLNLIDALVKRIVML